MTADKNLLEFRNILRRLERTVLNNIKDDSYCCGITANQCQILLGMGSKDNVAQSVLGNDLKIDKASLSRTMDGLVKNGLVKREICEHDRRYQDVSLTEKGLDFVNEINRTSMERYRSIFLNLGDEVRNRINEDMAMLIDSLNSNDLPERECCRKEVWNDK